MAKANDNDDSLKRLGGGRWQTRDERFTIEPQSGTWVVVDAEQTDDLGLALVRGPFGSLRDAKAAIETARGSGPAASPLTAKAKGLGKRTPAARASGSTTAASAKGTTATKPGTRRSKAAKPAEPAEPRWLTDLEPDARRRARRLIDRLTEAGAPDPEGLTRRDLVGDVPTVAAFATVQAVVALGSDATPEAVARVLVDGRDQALGVRWRLVDGDGRPLLLDLDEISRG
jgi:hypothetical protein